MGLYRLTKVVSLYIRDPENTKDKPELLWYTLVRLNVNFGDFKRSILVGLNKERENPKEIVGKQALFVVNLAPKEMMGELSEGMLFDIGYANGIIPVLSVPEKEVPDGVCAG